MICTLRKKSTNKTSNAYRKVVSFLAINKLHTESISLDFILMRKTLNKIIHTEDSNAELNSKTKKSKISQQLPCDSLNVMKLVLRHEVVGMRISIWNVISMSQCITTIQCVIYRSSWVCSVRKEKKFKFFSPSSLQVNNKLDDGW